tara:strand:+ start:3270 stop:3866 length:597 start_codon:yes stop_codon:yes gene_type:complete
MIEFIETSIEPPYKIFVNKYHNALNAGQKNIEAMSISSYRKDKNEVDSRYVNLKYIEKDKFIFFTNYNSPKALSFLSHNQISGLFFWSSINVQIRIKAIINKTTKQFNEKYFRKRSLEKNALAISSRQSKSISSFDLVIENYNHVKHNNDLSKCPDYWGGFSFKPFEIEIWEGSEFRLNKRDLYSKKDNNWSHTILEP